MGDIHTSCAARHLPAFLEALDLPASVRLVLALHEVIVIGLAPVADKVGRTHQWCGCGTNLLHLGDVIRHGSGVHEDLLVEPVQRELKISLLTQ